MQEVAFGAVRPATKFTQGRFREAEVRPAFALLDEIRQIKPPVEVPRLSGSAFSSAAAWFGEPAPLR
jgi:hypothetical protein